MNTAFLKSYECLNDIYQNGAFSVQALNGALASAKSNDKALITKIVYGTLDNDIKITYILSKFCHKMPKGDVLLFLKIGTYCLMDLSIPPYAVVNDIAELTKITGDIRQVGFVNATLKNISKNIASFNDYPTDEIERVAIVNSYPLWAYKKLVKDYGKETAKQIVECKLSTANTVRFVGEKTLDGEETVFCDAVKVQGKLPVESPNMTAQSLSSMAISRIVASLHPQQLLDACSAPGGKAVYIKQLLPIAVVTACDIHAHRTALIDSYAKRMGVEIITYVADSTVFNESWSERFDVVLCDVPCSGFGVLDNRPDIKLFRQNEDISSLMKTQYAILENCSKYVKKGGYIVYSTCTLFDNENGQNVRKFLKNNNNFDYGTITLPEFPNADGKGFYQFLPCFDGVQGFYVAVLTRKE